MEFDELKKVWDSQNNEAPLRHRRKGFAQPHPVEKETVISYY